MKTLIAIMIVALLIIGAAAWRWWQILPYPAGAGQFRTSPNGQYEAHATTVSDQDFWGKEKDWYEFSIIPKGSTAPTKTLRKDISPGEAVFNMRTTNQVIHWAEDSKSVTFLFQSKEIKMDLEPAR